MDIAAEIIGVNPLRAKLTAFAVSGFYVGVAGALFFSVYLGAVEVGEAFGIDKSFLVLFMIIIGGLGSIFGSFAGAAFMVLLPVLLKNVCGRSGLAHRPCRASCSSSLSGGLIVMFLILEPHGLAAALAAGEGETGFGPFRIRTGAVRSRTNSYHHSRSNGRIKMKKTSNNWPWPP